MLAAVLSLMFGLPSLSANDMRFPRDTRCYVDPEPYYGFDSTWDHCTAAIDAFKDRTGETR